MILDALHVGDLSIPEIIEATGLHRPHVWVTVAALHRQGLVERFHDGPLNVRYRLVQTSLGGGQDAA